MSNSDLNIYQRLHAIMQDIVYIKKEDKKVNNQYTFVSHDAVTAKIAESFIKHRVFGIPTYKNIKVNGNRTECELDYKFINIDKPDDFIHIECAGFGHGIDNQDKGPGKAMSYAFKYAMLKVFGIETGDDPERDNINHKTELSIKADELQKRLHTSLKSHEDKDSFSIWWRSESTKLDRSKLKELDSSKYIELVAEMKKIAVDLK